uniref:Uncharacterized protein n=1 Tax=Spodoptera frugiperda nuclear polyhedrosis virus TaxID=10455 RepID=A0A8F2DD83_NPVSF|nr:hypothetical protein [Spodoptera frugiperda multiple nucleopolyhedrovirus]
MTNYDAITLRSLLSPKCFAESKHCSYCIIILFSIFAFGQVFRGKQRLKIKL